MWKSPIDVIYDDVQTTFENEVLKTVQSVHINVDREELLKALAYDRNQYEKGYADGQKDATKHGRWEKIEIIDDDSDSGVNDEAARCSVCEGVQSSYYWATNYYNYCPECGAIMDEEGQKMPDVQEYIELMRAAVEKSNENEEIGHNMADGILRDFLTELGYEDLVKEWDNVKKWYA